MIILDSGPLIALVVHKLGLGCSSAAPPELVDAVKKVEERLGLRLASLWPVVTEALHILDSRCRISKRSDAPEKIKTICKALSELAEIHISFHEALKNLKVDLDIADPAVLLAAERSKPSIILTIDQRLLKEAERRKLQAFTPYMIASLL